MVARRPATRTPSGISGMIFRFLARQAASSLRKRLRSAFFSVLYTVLSSLWVMVSAPGILFLSISFFLGLGGSCGWLRFRWSSRRFAGAGYTPFFPFPSLPSSCVLDIWGWTLLLTLGVLIALSQRDLL